MKRIHLVSLAGALALVTAVLAVLFLSPGAEPGATTPLISWEPKEVVVTVTSGETDEQTLSITVTNRSTKKTWAWFGSCSLTLQWYKADTWDDSPAPWSGCSSCGVEREIPAPLFLAPGATGNILWDQIVIWCDHGNERPELASGRYRFVFRYVEDKLECRSTLDPLKCWLDYHDKQWRKAYSDEFTIRGDSNPP